MGKMSRFDWNPLYESPLEGGPTLGRCPRRVLQDLRDVPRGCGQIGLFGQQARQPVGQELRVIERSVGLRSSASSSAFCARSWSTSEEFVGTLGALPSGDTG